MEQRGAEAVILAMVALFGLCTVIVFLFIIFQKKKNFLLIKQIEDKKKFDQEIDDLQIEIREQTLRNISWELHDNIGQMLTFSKIRLQSLPENSVIEEVKENLGNILNEVRALSRNINPEFINNINLIKALELEVERFNRLNYIKAKLQISGAQFKINQKAEIVIFRILQEFFANTIKYSQATELFVEILFLADNKLNIIAKDNGIGFDVSEKLASGIGLLNMQKRAKLINAELKIKSQKNLGTELNLNYTNENH